jgi:shikimate kinase
MRNEPVLIGPICVGKTSVAAALAEMLELKHIELDECGADYYRRAPGFDPARADELYREHGYVARYRYWEQTFPWVLGQVFADHHDCVFDLGAGHTCLLDTERQFEVQAQLAPFATVILLLPSSDPAASITVIRDRLQRDPERGGHVWAYDDVDFIHHWVTSGQNQRLATHVVVTGDRQPVEVADEIRTRLSARGPAR